MKIPYRARILWFHCRQHFTKAAGGVGAAIGYGEQHRAEWVQYISDAHRGTFLKWWGIGVLLLGFYNWLAPNNKPASDDQEPPAP